MTEKTAKFLVSVRELIRRCMGENLQEGTFEYFQSSLNELIEEAKKEDRETIAKKAEEKAKEIEPDSYDRDYAENDSAGFNADRQTARTLREFAQEIRARSDS